MYRTVPNQKRYQKAQADETKCPFCQPEPSQVVAKSPNFLIIENIYGYDLWDRHKVKKHFLIITKIHSPNLLSINKETAIEYFKLLEKYSEEGFDIFTRATNSNMKSQPHFHTHLIKTHPKIINYLHFEADPHQLSFK